MPASAQPTLLDPAELAHLVGALVGSDVATDGPHVVRVRSVGTELELAVRSTGGEHPAVHLPGLVAGDDWLAVGISALGRARPLEGPGVDDSRRVRTAHLVGRDGGWATRWEPAGDGGDGRGDGASQAGGAAGAAHGPAGDPALPSGRVDDLCRRTFGLATPPPAADTWRLWTVMWLDAVLALASVAADLSVDQIARLHPAGQRARRRSWTWSALTERAADLAGERTWSDVRRSVAAGELVLDGIEPSIAAWHDDGSFSRCALAAWPELVELRDAVAGLLPPTTMRGIDHVVAAT